VIAFAVPVAPTTAPVAASNAKTRFIAMSSSLLTWKQYWDRGAAPDHREIPPVE
jgi:hypothetical protein